MPPLAEPDWLAETLAASNATLNWDAAGLANHMVFGGDALVVAAHSRDEHDICGRS